MLSTIVYAIVVIKIVENDYVKMLFFFVPNILVIGFGESTKWFRGSEADDKKLIKNDIYSKIKLVYYLFD